MPGHRRDQARGSAAAPPRRPAPSCCARIAAARRTQPKAARTSGHGAAVASRPLARIARSRVSSFGSPFLRPTRSRLAATCASRSAQLQPRGLQRRPAVVGQRRADRRAVAPDRLGLGVVAALDLPLDRPDAADLLLQLDLGVAVGLVDRPGRLAEVVELAELVGHAVEGLGDRLADRVLAVGDHPGDRHRQGRLHLAEQLGQVVLASRRAGSGPAGPRR